MYTFKDNAEVRTASDLDPYNFKTRKIPFDEKVAVVKHQGEYGDLTIICTIDQLLEKLKEDDFTVIHSQIYNRIMASSERNGCYYNTTFEYYTIS